MLKKRSSRAGFLFSSQSKRHSAPPPKPGRTLTLSSTSSMMDLGNIPEQGFVFDFEQQQPIDELSVMEPLFLDCFLPPGSGGSSSSSPPLASEQPWPMIPSREPSLRWSMDEESSLSDESLDTVEDSLPEGMFIATCISVVFKGKPKIVDLSPTRSSFERPRLHPLQSRSGHTSRTSSVSTRDFASSPSSDGGSKPSPASSISEYSNLAYETIPEEPMFHSHKYGSVDMKPFKRSFHHEISPSASSFEYDVLNDSSIRAWGC